MTTIALSNTAAGNPTDILWNQFLHGYQALASKPTPQFTNSASAGGDQLSYTLGSGARLVFGGDFTLSGGVYGGKVSSLALYQGSTKLLEIQLLGTTLAPGQILGAGYDALAKITQGFGSQLGTVWTGAAGADQLVGGSAVEVFQSLGSRDSVWGGGGNDSYLVSTADVRLVELAGGGTDTVSAVGLTTFILPAEVENLQFTATTAVTGSGNALANQITGNGGNDTLLGLAGNDSLSGNAGNDLLDGGSGSDTLTGGLGDDSYVIDSATDKVVEKAGEGSDTVITSIALAKLPDNVDNLTLTGAANLVATGSAGNNIITGNAGHNLLAGGGGSDTLIGGAGNDTYLVDSWSTTIQEGPDVIAGGALWATVTSAGAPLNTDATNAALSGNGQQVLFRVSPGYNFPAGTPSGLVMKNAASGELASIAADTNIYSFDLTADANTIAYRQSTGIKLWQGGTTTTVVNSTSASLMDLSASGRLVLVYDASNMKIYDLQAGTNTSIGYGATGKVLDDGRVVYSYTDSNYYRLASPSDVNGYQDIFLRDTAGNSSRISGGLNGAESNGHSNLLAVSPDGRWVLFESSANNLVANDTNTSSNNKDVFLRDTLAGTTQLISVDALGVQLPGGAQGGGISADGRYVAYVALESGHNSSRLFVRDMVAGQSTQVELHDKFGAPAQVSDYARISADGSTLLVSTYASIAAGDTGSTDAYLIQNPFVAAQTGGIDTIRLTPSNTPAAPYLLPDYVENLELLGSQPAEVTGNSLANRLVGNSGANTLDGGFGDDILVGGTNDVLIGGAGNDSFEITAGAPTLTEGANEGNDTVVSAASFSLADTPNIENLTLTGAAAINGTGNDTANTITGNAGKNLLDGGAGNDRLIGGAGDDSYRIDSTTDDIIELDKGGIDLVEASANYTLPAFVESLTLKAGASRGTGNDLANILKVDAGNTAAVTVNGGGGNDSLSGGTGGDSLDGGTGDDAMIGGAGDDSYRVDSTKDTVKEDSAANGSDTVEASVSFTLGNFVDKLVLTGSNKIDGKGNADANTITGNGNDNLLDGQAGNDTLDGGAGNDKLLGGDGDDSLLGGGGNDSLDGGKGNDTMNGGAGDDAYVVDNAGDTLADSGGVDSVLLNYAPAGKAYTLADTLENVILGAAGNINLSGNDLANLLKGNAGNNTLTGGLGDDVYDISAGGSDTIVEAAEAGNDSVVAATTVNLATDARFVNLENATLTGTTALNAIGNATANRLEGNAGNNLLDGGAGDDTLIGGAGNDTYKVDSPQDTATEADKGGTDLVMSTLAEFTLPAFVENLTLDTGAGTGRGNALANILTGNGSGNELDGQAGDDTLLGGAGSDTYVVDSAKDKVDEAKNTDAGDTVRASIDYTLGLALENLELTGGGGLKGIGNAAGNRITGNAGNNFLDGGTGIDTLTGGDGDDTYVADVAADTVVETGSGNDTLVASFTADLAGYANIENLSLAGTAALNATGSGGDNRLIGNAGANTLTGNGGNDLIDGGAGADRLNGGSGNDTYVADNAGDVVTDAGGNDEVRASANHTLATGIEKLVLTGTAAITGTGNSGDNVLIGNGGTNTLTGNAGNDRLDGGAGADKLIGGAGDDSYVIDNTADAITEAASAGTDTVFAAVTIAKLADNVEDLILTGTGLINGTGNGLANSLTGNQRANILDGGLGADTLNGGGGDDTYLVDSSDTVIETGSFGPVQIMRVSATVAGGELDNSSGNATALSADGRYVLFDSFASNIVAGGTAHQVYIKDTATGAVTNVSHGSSGAPVAGLHFAGDLSADGKWAVFASGSDSFATGIANNNKDDVYLFDVAKNKFTLVSHAVGSASTGGNGYSGGTGISADGRYVVFGSAASNLVAGDGENNSDIFRFDAKTGVVARVSELGGVGGNAGSGMNTNNEVSADGRFVAFASLATNLAPGVGDGAKSVIYVKDMTSGTLAPVVNANSILAGMSADGRHVMFYSSDDNLVAGDTNANWDVFVKDMRTGEIRCLSTLPDGSFANTYSMYGDLSADGRFAAFVSRAALVADDSNGLTDVYVRDLVNGNLARVSLAADGSEASTPGSTDVIGNILSISADGKWVSFSSLSPNLVPGDTNGTADVFKASNPLSDALLGDEIRAGSDYTLPAGVERLSLTGTGHFAATGNAGDNLLKGNAGNNTLTGLAGNDVYDLTVGGTDSLVEAAGGGSDTVIVAATVNLTDAKYANIENVVLAGSAALNATGTAVANRLEGNAGKNLLDGGAGIDTLVGGAGDDSYKVDAPEDRVVELDKGGSDLVISSAESYRLSDFVENLELAAGAGSGMGNALANRIVGNTGANQLDGGQGDDTLIGGANNDTYYLDSAKDKADEGSNVDPADVVHVSFDGYILGNGLEHLFLDGAALKGTGNAAANTITGNAVANLIDGGLGADTLVGGAGDDTYLVDNVADVVTEQPSGGNDTVKASVGYRLLGNTENLILTGTAAINGTGDAGANRLTGNTAVNTLSGGDGNDLLIGGGGKDVYVGGSGFDQFWFGNAPGAATALTVTDFAAGDKIVLDPAVFKLGVTGTLPESMLHAGAGYTAAVTPEQRLIYDTDSGKLYYDADAIGSGAPQLVAEFAPGASHPTLTAGDFLIG